MTSNRRTPGRTPAYDNRGIGICDTCGKVKYRSRKEARTAKRIMHPDEKMDVYPCGNYFHFGHNDEWRQRPLTESWKPLPSTAAAQMRLMGEARDRAQ